MELVDVVDSKSTDGDIVPVRVRPPAPKTSRPQRGRDVFCAGGRKRERSSSLGREPTAASGGVKEGERVAGVDEGRRCFVTEDIRRAPQQDTGISFYATADRFEHIAKGTVRWTLAATSSQTGGYNNFHRR